MDQEQHKQIAAEAALGHVVSGMALGLGTGTTATWMVRGLAARLRDGRLRDIVGVPTSDRTAALARELGIPLALPEQLPRLDLAIDGADEITPALDLIKGLGGALLREKIVAASAARFVVIGDDSKRVAQLGQRTPVPVEVVGFGLPLCERRLRELGGVPELRRTPDGAPYRTDEGHFILDVRFAPFGDPAALGRAIDDIPGVVEHGLFVGMAALAVLGGPGGVLTLRPQR